jgi:hypothetical protein
MKNILVHLLAFCSISIPFYAQTINEPTPFLPEVMSAFPNVRDIAIYKNEVYFTLQSFQEEFSAILVVKNENGKWGQPSVVNFSGQYSDLEPFITADGLKIYFASNRPLDITTKEAKDFDLWYVERKSISAAWSTPVNMGAPLNTEYNEFYPSLSAHHLFYTSDQPGSKGKDDIFTCMISQKKYSDPVSMSDSINTTGYEFNAFIAPDESFMIYTGYNRKGGLGSGDLYICFKDNQGNWGSSKTLGPKINSDRMDYCPYVDLNTGTLYFTSRRNLVKTRFEKPQALDELMKEFNQYENGLSRIYEVNIKHLLH